ncbi:hypothetical protein OJ252_1016 [Cryptosporidium canis]|uniref:Uncharacterized protein n=1 Tax=Cryptosporidium canis TaxID=195482 RepID=A0ABQ8P9V0_9CRYT|nr:hypothetical protein OJ252_1016 [Cryptosporidium canis]
MEKEIIIAQVLEELKQSIILINDSLGTEKYDTSSISNLSLSTILNVCDIHIVDELPQFQARAEDLLVMPFEESQTNMSMPQNQHIPPNYIILPSSGYVSIQNEAMGGASWNYYDDCESTSEGSFMSDCDDEEASDIEIDMSDFDQSFSNHPNPDSGSNPELLQMRANGNDFVGSFGQSHLNGSSRNEPSGEVSPISFGSNSPFCHESVVENQDGSGPVPMDSENALKRQPVTEIEEDGRDLKMAKYDSQLPSGRDEVFY